MLFVAFTTLLSFCSKGHAAEISNATVSTEYIDYSSLNPTEQRGIIKGKPNSLIKHDKEIFSLVYKKIENKSTIFPSSSNVLPMNNSTSLVSSNNAGLLPQTGEQSSLLLYVLGLLIIVITGFSLYRWKRTKQIILMIITVGSLGFLKNVSAETLGSFPNNVTTEYLLGSEYSGNVPSISGYEYIGYLHNYSDHSKPNGNGTVMVQFVDEADKEVAPSKTLTGIIGSTYTTSSESITGYNLLTTPNNANGKFTLTPQTVKYIYKKVNKNGTVTVQFVDEADKEVAPSKTLTGIIGSTYTTSPESIAGYALSTTPSNANGKFTLIPQKVKYIYKKVVQNATITVKFVDKSGNPFVIPDFTTLKNGEFVSQYPNLQHYSTLLDFNGQTYNQKQTVSDLSLPAKIGEKYSLPKQVIFHIKDDKGNDVDYLMSPDPDGSLSGIEYWYSHDTPNNISGIVDKQEVVVTYIIEGEGVITPP
ncbi:MULTISPECIES: MucBP domain-containing protein [Lactococcus]|nr:MULTISPECIES: MucBP domain-containing protein [Lactococcus]MCA2390147.1 MucBP domain-containing protein [Lactococcus sp. NH2-7C]MCT1181987.1 LPXTG cell wall anchor domain-containing protein [Lactococcus lactis]MCT1194943.1 LPXTG cell wall anchor domain-containing protein [Lactococcus lactis]